MNPTVDTNPDMGKVVKSDTPIKVSEREYDRLKKFGYAGESINDALIRVLDIAEKNKPDTLTPKDKD
jgi:hypothetical protein